MNTKICGEKTIQDNGTYMACTRKATLEYRNGWTKVTTYFCGLHAKKLKKLGWTFEAIKS